MNTFYITFTGPSNSEYAALSSVISCTTTATLKWIGYSFSYNYCYKTTYHIEEFTLRNTLGGFLFSTTGIRFSINCTTHEMKFSSIPEINCSIELCCHKTNMAERCIQSGEYVTCSIHRNKLGCT